MQPTRKLFWEDPYCCEAAVTIDTVDGDWVTVDQTIAYALAGGQESDAGTIGGYAIRQAEKQGSVIRYQLSGDHTLQPGQQVQMAIDWDRRYALMRLHFAAELILELMLQRFPETVKIGAHIAADKARVDFLWPENISRLFAWLEAAAADIIAAQRPIVSGFTDEAAEQRHWEIAGFAKVACGGTHLRHTGEIGTLRLRRHNIGKGKERIEISLA